MSKKKKKSSRRKRLLFGPDTRPHFINKISDWFTEYQIPEDIDTFVDDLNHQIESCLRVLSRTTGRSNHQRKKNKMIGAFLNHMHPFLQRQLNYSIYFWSPSSFYHGAAPFNRASLLNVGFKEARKEGPWDCYAFHDIDLLPENDFHLYHCSPQPRHLAVALSTFKIPYHSYFGGGCLMMESHILKVNGWSNMYWGWGGEDDDMWNRVTSSDMTVWRYPNPYVRYKMIQHIPAAPNQER
ncbi:beta-1,4-galactosyltransferase 4-like [Procambarus clarkii]|uniref:beta-1,4-galactosyltransferase 4-like n=1 Tax=Procambarus clarkii TaxID=6728 RepID=UPI0037424B42